MNARGEGRGSAGDELRRLGLPLVLDRRARASGLLRRCAPLMAALATLLSGFAAFDRANLLADEYFERVPESEVSVTDPFFRGVFVGTVLLLCSPLLAWVTTQLVRRVRPHIGDAIGAACAAALLIAPVLTYGLGSGPSLLTTVCWLVGVLLAGYFGLGTIVRWSARRVVRELSTLVPMVARVLPLLMIALLFFFYNAEIWQVTVSLSWSRTRWVVALILLLATLLAVMMSRDELRAVIAEHSDVRTGGTTGAVPLRPTERINLLVIPCLVVLIQAALFATVVFGFFVLFGWLSVSEATAAQWTGQPARRFEGVLARVPVSPTLIKVSVTLAAFSALNLIATSATDRQHRERYVEPLLEEIVHSLAVRDAYLARHRPQGVRHVEH